MTDHYVYGLHAVNALLTNPKRQIKSLYISSDTSNPRFQALLQRLPKEVSVEYVPNEKLIERFGQVVHQGIVACTTALPEYSEADLLPLIQASENPHLILILDGITDPHNLGACLRSADAAGVDFVIIPKDKNTGITPVVSKVASGAVESVPLVRVTNLVRAMGLLKQEGIWIYGAAGEASDNMYQIDYTGSVALVMGAEGKGIRRLTRDHCDGLFSLPMLGSVTSLNVSVATGISLYEVVRQRQARS